jgi:hypothetical protein
MPKPQRRFRPRTLALCGVTLVLSLVAAAWAVRVPPGETPYLRIAGAGFMFNYRIADAYYGFTAQVMKPVKNASVIEARFEDPAGGRPIVATEKLWPKTRQYDLRTPPLHGIEKDRPYHVTVRLLQQGDGAVLFEDAFTVTSSLSSAVMPSAPLTIGPGYTKNPDVAPEG